MTFVKHFKFTFRGIFTNTPEIWSFGCHMSRLFAGAPDAGVDDIDNDAVTSALRALLSNGGSSTFGQAVHATDWRAYEIGTNGRMEGNPLVVDVSADSIGGTGGTVYPPQVSLCVTTVADNRGPARFGRFYLPGPSASLGSDLRLSAGVADGYGEAATQFLKSVSDAVDALGLRSSSGLNVSGLPSSSGTNQIIDHVEVGRVLDTIRTRRNGMLEDRQVHGHIDW